MELNNLYNDVSLWFLKGRSLCRSRPLLFYHVRPFVVAFEPSCDIFYWDFIVSLGNFPPLPPIFLGWWLLRVQKDVSSSLLLYVLLLSSSPSMLNIPWKIRNPESLQVIERVSVRHLFPVATLNLGPLRMEVPRRKRYFLFIRSYPCLNRKTEKSR